MLNLKNGDIENDKTITFVSMNNHEAEKIYGDGWIDNNIGNKDICKKVCDKVMAETVVITFGADGYRIFNKNMASPIHEVTNADGVDIISESGCGDSLFSSCAISYLSSGAVFNWEKTKELIHVGVMKVLAMRGAIPEIDILNRSPYSLVSSFIYNPIPLAMCAVCVLIVTLIITSYLREDPHFYWIPFVIMPCVGGLLGSLLNVATSHQDLAEVEEEYLTKRLVLGILGGSVLPIITFVSHLFIDYSRNINRGVSIDIIQYNSMIVFLYLTGLGVAGGYATDRITKAILNVK